MFWEIFGQENGSEALIKAQQNINAGAKSEIDTKALASDTGKVISQEMVNGKMASQSTDGDGIEGLF